jgi:hypothetical protein
MAATGERERSLEREGEAGMIIRESQDQVDRDRELDRDPGCGIE